MKIFKNLDTLKSHLQLPEINTGQLFTNHIGMVFTTDEGLYSMLSADHSCVHLSAGVEWALVEFRGQTRNFCGCYSGLDRCKTDVNLFLALLRGVAFDLGLRNHPALIRMQKETFFGKPFSVDKEGVAQHYGLATDYIDINPNFDVASFFAMQKWNAKTHTYEPMKACQQPGVMYKLIPALTMLPKRNEAPAYTSTGWQPF